ncbi:MAG: ABC transporter substrate-binding protein [Coriobacteriales bacterium]
MKNFSRRGFLKTAVAGAATVAAAGALAGCTNSGNSGAASGNGAATDIELNPETEQLLCALLGKDLKIACIIIASQEGLYQEEGLEVSFETVANLSDAITAVSEDKLDVLPFGVIPTCTFVGQGVENVMVFGGTIAEGSECITLPQNKDKFTKVEDFANAKIAYFPMETGHLVMQGLQEEAGSYNPDNWVIMSDQQSIIQAVAKGECDCGFLNSGQGYLAMQSGVVTSMHVGDLKPDFPCCRQTTSMTSFTEKKSALLKFTIANLRAQEIFYNDKPRALAALSAFSGQPQDYCEAVLYGNDEYSTPMVVEMDPYTDAVCAFYETMKATENISPSTTYKMEDHVDSTIYEAALYKLIDRNDDKSDYFASLEASFKEHNSSAS